MMEAVNTWNVDSLYQITPRKKPENSHHTCRREDEISADLLAK
jgi:hypothetical protein